MLSNRWLTAACLQGMGNAVLDVDSAENTAVEFGLGGVMDVRLLLLRCCC